MLKRKAKIKVCDDVLRKALKARKIIFRKMRQKPILTVEDIKARYKFAKKYRFKSKGWWCSYIQLFIDLKNFQVYTNGKSRAYAAMREVRGAYRGFGEGLDLCYVVVPKNLRCNTGARSVRIAAGIGGGKSPAGAAGPGSGIISTPTYPTSAQLNLTMGCVT